MSTLYQLFSSALPRKIVGTLGTIKVILPSYLVNKCILFWSSALYICTTLRYLSCNTQLRFEHISFLAHCCILFTPLPLAHTISINNIIIIVVHRYIYNAIYLSCTTSLPSQHINILQQNFTFSSHYNIRASQIHMKRTNIVIFSNTSLSFSTPIPLEHTIIFRTQLLYSSTITWGRSVIWCT